ncbi:hypothetical protein [Arthrobacter sp.]|uniref:hypothetical protein n=1 Tax=Arthrobacter sp. TaxID=1667 RepID=UPI00258295D9|nr:hypothetical protein [Arthrobacter sp.]
MTNFETPNSTPAEAHSREDDRPMDQRIAATYAAATSAVTAALEGRPDPVGVRQALAALRVARERLQALELALQVLSDLRDASSFDGLGLDLPSPAWATPAGPPLRWGEADRDDPADWE